MNDVNGESIYRDMTGDGMEMQRAIRNACHGIRPQSALVYLGEEQAWDEFYGALFNGVLLPHFALVYGASCAGEMDQVIAADDRLLEQIPALAAARLSACSSAVFNARGGAKAIGLLGKLREKRPECSFTTAFAVHATLFSLPLLQAAMAYAYIEWSMGAETAGLAGENPVQWEEMFYSEIIGSSESIREVLARHFNGWKEIAGGIS
ncbi:MAG: hypothetical protein VCA55_14120 [Verrucomicrobiales bacterium]